MAAVVVPDIPRAGRRPTTRAGAPRLRLVAADWTADDADGWSERWSGGSADGRIVEPCRPSAGVVRRHSPEVYRRRRTVVLGLLGAVAIGLWLAGQALFGPARPPSLGSARTVAVHVWTVKPGQTLWSIAVAIDPNGEVRPLVDALSAEVHDQPIQPGERIAIP